MDKSVRPSVSQRALLIALALMLAACAPRQQPLLPDLQGPRLTDTAFIAADGKEMAVQRWGPPGDAPLQAVFVAVHGFNDYANAFDSSASWFADAGILTIAYDQRGFGHDAEAGLWAGGARMAADLRQLLVLVRREHPGTPLYVLGQSMGGAVALLALAGEGAGDADPIAASVADGVILVAPAVWGWSSMNIFYRAGLWLSAHTTPGWQLTGKSLDVMPSDNIEMLRAQGRDPLVIKRTRVDAIYGLVTLMDDALEVAPQVRLPVLLLYGAKDDIIPSKPMAKLHDRLGAHEYRLYADGYHMLLRGLRPDAAFADILEFIGESAPEDLPEYGAASNLAGN
ncbi:MAG: alpha/beta hydrolase [Proteobacteria bacterium]|nr:alpha/beta hydrolase [Pseudomonadota bacterium]